MAIACNCIECLTAQANLTANIVAECHSYTAFEDALVAVGMESVKSELEQGTSSSESIERSVALVARIAVLLLRVVASGVDKRKGEKANEIL